MVPFRRLGWPLVGVVTAFTVAHSITLIAAAYGAVPSRRWFPPLVETLIAASILYMAIENVLRPEPALALDGDRAVRPGARLRLLVPAANELQFVG